MVAAAADDGHSSSVIVCPASLLVKLITVSALYDKIGSMIDKAQEIIRFLIPCQAMYS